MKENIKLAIAMMISYYLNKNYSNSATNLTYDIIIRSLDGYDEENLFSKVFTEESIEDFVIMKWIPNDLYPIGAKNCNVTIGQFTTFMDEIGLFSGATDFNMQWIDILYATIMNREDVCKLVHDKIVEPQQQENETDNTDCGGFNNFRLQENAIEIALVCFDKLYRDGACPRAEVIDTIQNWAVEAEKEWVKGEHDYDYLGFIKKFTEARIANFLKEEDNGKKKDDLIDEIAKKYSLEYTDEGCDRCTYEEVKEAIKTSINSYIEASNNN